MEKTWVARSKWRIFVGVVTAIFIVAVVWLDIRTGLWAETVILSGIAAGLLTFLLTALFVERWMAQREHIKWLPVTRVAITDLLHSISDEKHSDIHRGLIVARTLPSPQNREEVEGILRLVVAERRDLTDAMAKWSGFLAGSADVQELMIVLAHLAQQLDLIRDEAVEVDQLSGDLAPEAFAELHREVDRFNNSTGRAATTMLELLGRIEHIEAEA